ncbi:hypothetical protein PRJ39_07965 [Lysobacter enzymogenes]|uniref:hypothetical protein n=1 Tax=Lysobacter enzymogenes TaxID=69 RepID=UPI003748DE54
MVNTRSATAASVLLSVAEQRPVPGSNTPPLRVHCVSTLVTLFGGAMVAVLLNVVGKFCANAGRPARANAAANHILIPVRVLRGPASGSRGRGDGLDGMRKLAIFMR